MRSRPSPHDLDAYPGPSGSDEPASFGTFLSIVMCMVLVVVISLVAFIARGDPQGDADTSLADQVAELRQTIRLLQDQAKAIKDATGDKEIQTNARAIERIAGVAKTLGVELGKQVGVEPSLPPVVEPPAPTPTDPPDAGFTPIDPADALLLPKTVTASQLQDALNQHDKIGLPAGVTVKGALAAPRSTLILFAYGEGARPIIEVPEGKDGLDLTADRIEQVIIQGIEIKGPGLPHRGVEQGIRLRLSSAANQYAKDMRVEDCKVSGFDTLIEVVDDRPRVEGYAFQRSGRIKLAVIGCILTDAEGSDSHSAGIYTEGLDLGSVIADNAIARIRTVEPDKRSHGVYGQGHGAPTTYSGNLLHRCSAQGIQARAGGTLTDNLVNRCGVGMFVQGNGSIVRRNVVMNGVDISGDLPRGHAYQLVFGKGVIEDNLAAFNGGSTKSIPAFKDMWSPKSFERNIAVQWQDQGQNFDISGDGRYGSLGSNRTLAGDPGFAPIDIDAWLGRKRSEPVPSVAGVIDAMQEAIE